MLGFKGQSGLVAGEDGASENSGGGEFAHSSHDRKKDAAHNEWTVVSERTAVN